MDIIDRRPNPHGKNIENRRRVLVRAREAVQRAARDAVTSGRLREVGQGRSISIPSDALHEPTLHRVFSSGTRDIVLSGNRVFSPGDRIQRPKNGQGKGGAGAGEGGQEGGAEDDFRFVLSRDEFLDVFFDDLELPDLVKQQIATADAVTVSRAGLSSDGSPSQLDLGRTMRHSMARRIGLKRPKPEAVTELELRIEALDRDGADADPDALLALRSELATALRRMGRVPWIDPVDLRYRRFTLHPASLDPRGDVLPDGTCRAR